jgi:hypothetical protein
MNGPCLPSRFSVPKFCSGTPRRGDPRHAGGRRTGAAGTGTLKKTSTGRTFFVLTLSRQKSVVRRPRTSHGAPRRPRGHSPGRGGRGSARGRPRGRNCPGRPREGAPRHRPCRWARTRCCVRGSPGAQGSCRCRLRRVWFFVNPHSGPYSARARQRDMVTDKLANMRQGERTSAAHAAPCQLCEGRAKSECLARSTEQLGAR